jgi:hypothetical protein
MATRERNVPKEMTLSAGPAFAKLNEGGWSRRSLIGPGHKVAGRRPFAIENRAIQSRG